MPPADPSPAAPPILVQAAARLLAEGRAAEAAARLEALAVAAPAYPAAHVLLARALEAAGREDDALAAWHHAHFLMPNSPLVRRERRRLLEAHAATLVSPADTEAPFAEPAAAEDAVEDARVAPVPAAPEGEPAALPDTLDALIRALEDAPRIRPDPTFRSPEVALVEGDADDMVSETLARIYAAQKQYAEAALVYEKLARQRPEDAGALLKHAAAMRAQEKG